MRAAWNVPRHLALIALAGLTSAGPLSAAMSGSSAFSPVGSGGKAPEASAGAARRKAIDFVEAENPDVAKALSVQSGANIVVSPNAKGKVTLRLRGTTLEEALRFVSQVAGFDFLRAGETYVIGTA